MYSTIRDSVANLKQREKAVSRGFLCKPRTKDYPFSLECAMIRVRTMVIVAVNADDGINNPFRAELRYLLDINAM